MENKVKKFGLTVGLGALAYWVIQGFRKSDGSFSGTAKEAARDLNKGYRWFCKTAKRTLSAAKWRKADSSGSPNSAKWHQGDRSNGGTLPNHSTPPVSGTELRNQIISGKTI